MRKSRFNEERIIAILKESAWGGDRGAVSEARHHAGVLLPVEVEVRRRGCERGQAAADDFKDLQLL